MIVPFFQVRDFPFGILQELQNNLFISLEKGEYILGNDVKAFEDAFAKYVGAQYCIGVGNGYDALVLSLLALGVSKGDEVIMAANGYAATMNAVNQAGASLVLVDPDKRTYNLEAPQVETAFTENTKAILPIHLYGQPCFMPALMNLAAKYNAFIIEDCAQAHGATVRGQAVGTFGSVNAFSFYPTKNLGAVGDAGAVVTNDGNIAGYLRKYRNYGQTNRYIFDLVGINSRLDSIQAAVLSVKLAVLDKLNSERKRLASVYDEMLSGVGDLILPYVTPGVSHVYHIYVIRTEKRPELQQYLQANGISTLIHYPVPPHLQPAYRHLGYKKGDFPITEELAETSLSLPLFPGMTEAEQAYVIEQLKSFFS